jgi:hypothetical protein
MRQASIALSITLFLSAAVFSQGYAPGIRLTASDGVTLSDVSSVSGDTAVVGATVDAANRGAVYVFVRSGGVWVEQQKLIASDGVVNDRLGVGVAISGDTIIARNNRTAAYVFVRSGNTWTEQQKLTVTEGVGPYGNPVAIMGDTAVVGARTDDNFRGAAFVFVRSGNVWSLQQKLVDPDAPPASQLGNAVAFWGDTIIVGAFAESQGSISIFERTGTSWTRVLRYVATNSLLYRGFGRYVTLRGNSAIVGSTFMEEGRIAFFGRTGSEWAFSGSSSGQGLYGRAVAYSGVSYVVSSLVPVFNGPIQSYVGKAWINGQELVLADGSALYGIDHLQGTGNHLMVGIHAFSLVQPLQPVSINGRVLGPTGNGLPGTMVHAIDANGNRRTVLTNPAGYYRINGMDMGPVFVKPGSKRFRYAARAVTATDDLANIAFTPLP